MAAILLEVGVLSVGGLIPVGLAQRCQEVETPDAINNQ
jgi:hypothetical protein